MKVTFLIGNGFDLSCGLKTRYTDSYPAYIKEPTNNRTINDFKKTINRNFKTWGDFEMGMASYAHNLKSEEELIDCIRDYTFFLKKYLEEQQSKYLNVFPTLSLDYRRELSKCIINSVDRFYLGVTNNVANEIEAKRGHNNAMHFYFINFNYTDVLQSVLKIAKESNPRYYDENRIIYHETIHIHGSLIDNDFLLGVDNENQLINLPYKLTRLGKTAFIKPLMNEAYDKARVDKTRSIITSSEVICVFGMSLGDSDLLWRKELSQWLENSPEHKLFYYNYDAMRTDNIVLMERLELSRNLSLELGHKLGVSDECAEQQIYIPVGRRFFDIEHISVTKTIGTEVPHPPISMRFR